MACAPPARASAKRITVDVDKLLDLDRSVEEGAIRHPAYAIGKWYWREIVQTEVVPPCKPLRRFTAAERECLLWADGVRIEKAHQGATYEGTFEGVLRKLEELLARDDYEPIRDVVGTLVARMRATLRHLIDIGVGYLSLNRGVPTLSGGERQRVRMARQLDCDLVDLSYILDEPTVGLHPRDVDYLIAMLHRLRDHGNSVLVVEHDPAVVRAADWIVDIGPRAGDGGGELVFRGRLGRPAARRHRDLAR